MYRGVYLQPCTHKKSLYMDFLIKWDSFIVSSPPLSEFSCFQWDNIIASSPTVCVFSDLQWGNIIIHSPTVCTFSLIKWGKRLFLDSKTKNRTESYGNIFCLTTYNSVRKSWSKIFCCARLVNASLSMKEPRNKSKKSRT